MDTHAFDGLARQIGRRRTLQALGGALVATASGIVAAGAKNNGKDRKQRKKKQQKLQQRIDRESLALCAGQVTECDLFIASNCGDNVECVTAGQVCCDTLANCDFAALVACLEETNGD